MKRLLTATALTLAAGAALAAPKSYEGAVPPPAAADKREIAALFDRWNATLRSGDPARVAALYADNGVLLPTVSNEVRVGTAAIERYFVDFLKLAPVGTINFREIVKLDEDTAVDAGVYTFDVTKDGKRQQVQARYNFVYERDNGQWRIVNHHSSMMPEPVPARTAAN